MWNHLVHKIVIAGSMKFQGDFLHELLCTFIAVFKPFDSLTSRYSFHRTGGIGVNNSIPVTYYNTHPVVLHIRDTQTQSTRLKVLLTAIQALK